MTLSRPAVVTQLAEVGVVLAETKMLMAKLKAGMLCGQVAECAAHHALQVRAAILDRRFGHQPTQLAA